MMQAGTSNLLWQYRLVLASVALAFVVVGLGAFTRLVDAGLGCPDWPGCYGHLLWPDTVAEQQAAAVNFPDSPVDTEKTWPEMVHRYFAGSLGLLIVAIAFFAYQGRKEGLDLPIKLPVALIALVTLQAAFGMWTVTLKLLPQVVTAHLLGGFCTLSLLWLLSLRIRSRFTEWKACQNRGPIKLAVVLLFLVVLQIALGGWVSSNYAALACADLPTCQGQWWPAANFSEGFELTHQIGPNYEGGLLGLEARTAIHLAHRIGAIIVLLVSLVFIFRLWQKHFNGSALTILAALGVQVALGLSNVFFALPLAVAVAHNIGGAVLLLVLISIIYKLYKNNQLTAMRVA
ncbi:COX15/CtaA family protein [Pseudoteredinibacter isoporae]|uniref:Cytochrome c oxidase assembly protein subunit 15 n=1 Tax=Pseudoteredinibacter isoporae TaxID=570281 RepID=A0A7X0MUC2_9GAMM|nr:COX15/CtaA family protein [Pseudoteredinibacter isoporae]MBB6520128.1 cytochrome c oxidase assembly protein subunit 15 [Pseudoteredinibacter isoporae]